MAFLDQINLAAETQFQQRVQAAIVHAAIAVASEQTGDVQTLSISGGPTSGTFTLAFGAQTTGAIAWNATAGAVQLALQNLSNIGSGGAACVGGPLPGAAVTITFTGSQGGTAQNVMTVGTNNLTGGSTPTPVIAHTTTGATFVNHANRMALAKSILNNPSSLAALMAIGVTDNPTVMSDVNLATLASAGAIALNSGVTEVQFDNDIQFQVNAIFDAYAGK
jgi:hypothetical protein